mgnify:FL=1|tara:strand:+ start:391 stop:1422 length:1032 start_codon:yes stop_codon:yes gene_type:complete
MKLSTIFSIIYINIIIWLKKLFGLKILPYKILLNLTDLCNSRCSFCDIWKIKPSNEINLTEIENIFKSLNTSLYWLALSGGEVTLVKYYKEMIDSLVLNCKNIKILAFTTNALAVNRAIEYANYAKQKGLDVLVTISLDGDENVHDKIRGIEGNYKKCFDLYYKLKSNNINCNFGITVSDLNTNFIKEKYVKYNNIIKAVTFVHNHGIYGINKELQDEEILKALKHIYKNYPITKLEHLIEKFHIKIAILFLKEKRKKNIINCDVINSSLHLMPNGDVKPCMFMNKLGNIRKKNINEILEDKNTIKVKNEIKKNLCPKCWMNCYSPHSIMQHPFKTFFKFLVG